MRNRNAGMVVAALLLSLMSAGCQSASPTTQPSAAVASPACREVVMCDKCTTTWTRSYEFNNKGMLMYSVKPEMVCSECSKAAQEYFATGKLPPNACPMCGSHLRVCKGVECPASTR